MKLSLVSLVGAAVVAASVLVTSNGRAGWQNGPYASCGASSSGGWCSGTFLGFRNSANANDSAWFLTSANGTGSPTWHFGAQWSGGYYSCTAPASMAATLPAASASRGPFYIQWDATGTCTYAGFYDDSAYASTW